jgi:hypothetical protein
MATSSSCGLVDETKFRKKFRHPSARDRGGGGPSLDASTLNFHASVNLDALMPKSDGFCNNVMGRPRH